MLRDFGFELVPQILPNRTEYPVHCLRSACVCACGVVCVRSCRCVRVCVCVCVQVCLCVCVYSRNLLWEVLEGCCDVVDLSYIKFRLGTLTMQNGVD